MSLSSKLLASSGGVDKTYVDDLFQAYTRTGTGASATVTTGINLSEKGGLIWSKGRSGVTDHKLTDTARGVTKALISNTTAAQTTDATGITAVSTTGHTVGADSNYNTSGATYVDWVFAKAPKFFDIVTYTGNGVAGRQIPHALGIAPGMVICKATSTTSNWPVYHRSLSVNNDLTLNSTSAAAANSAFGSPTDSVFTAGNNPNYINQSGITYVAYLFAHDPSAEGIIQCGSFVGTANGSASATLGFEAQFVMIKRIDAAEDWYVMDISRNMSQTNAEFLSPNTSAASLAAGAGFYPTSTGFASSSNFFSAGSTYIYLAIRRPNKPPTTGTQVYNAIARTGTGAAATVTGVGFAPDLAISTNRSAADHIPFVDRLRGATASILSTSTTAEFADAQGLMGFDVMDGIRVGTGAANLYWNRSSYPFINHFFKRAQGFMDICCYTGTGSATTVAHGLGVVPELMIFKPRSTTGNWAVGGPVLGSMDAYMGLNLTDAKTTAGGNTAFNTTAPTASVFTLGTGGGVNQAGITHVAYLFATLPGISKCGNYTGNGTTQTIPCGFTTGARFLLIKRTDAVGDWKLFDHARGIVSANDPHLALNTTAAEITTDDSVDPAASGFIVNEVAATNLNVLNGQYIFLAVA